MPSIDSARIGLPDQSAVVETAANRSNMIAFRGRDMGADTVRFDHRVLLEVARSELKQRRSAKQLALGDQGP